MLRKIKRTIIKWSLREIAKALKKHPDASYGQIEKIGLEDFDYIEEYNEFRLHIKAS